MVKTQTGTCSRVPVAKKSVIMQNTPYATECWIKQGSQPGPCVMIIGGLHGDEPAGYLAAQEVLTWTVKSGTLVVIPEAHKEAIRRKVRAYPDNFNNLFPGKRNGTTMQRLAYEVFNLIQFHSPQMLLTLHESKGFHHENPRLYGQTFCYDFRELAPLMNRVINNTNRGIFNNKHYFSSFIEAHVSCPTYQAWIQFRIPGVSIETSKTLPLEQRIHYQLAVIEEFLHEFNVRFSRDE